MAKRIDWGEVYGRGVVCVSVGVNDSVVNSTREMCCLAIGIGNVSIYLFTYQTGGIESRETNAWENTVPEMREVGV